MAVKVPEMAVLAVVLSAIVAVAVPGVGGMKAAERDQATQQDVEKVSTQLRRFHEDARSGSVDVRSITLESAASARIRAFPAQGAAILVEVHEGTYLPDGSQLIHRSDGSWCFALANDAGRVKVFHYDSVRGSGSGQCAKNP